MVISKLGYAFFGKAKNREYEKVWEEISCR